MEFQTIRTAERPGGIGVITLNRPEKRNAISILMRREISVCLDRWRDNAEIGTVIFTGAGPVFSAGFDLDEFRQPACFADLLESSSCYHRDLWRFPKPTIAAVNGPAMGGGFDLATLCDLRLCAESAIFGHPEVKFGAPPLFTPLRWIVGEGLARDLCLTGRRFDAREAHRIGLVSEVCGTMPCGSGRWGSPGLSSKLRQIPSRFSRDALRSMPTRALRHHLPSSMIGHSGRCC